MAERSSRWLNLFLLIVLACIVAGIIGWVVKGLLWLFIIAAVVFVAVVVGSAYGVGRRRGRR